MGISVVLLMIWRLSANTVSGYGPPPYRAVDCPISLMGTSFNEFSPYLVKIIETFADSTFKTVGHGSLILTNRVISTCGPFHDYPEAIAPHEIWMIGVNMEEEDCDQRVRSTRVVLHPTCKRKDPKMHLVKHDIAIWVTPRWKVTYEYIRERIPPNPRYPLYDYYFNFPEPKWLKATMMFMTLSGCASGNQCQFPVFDYYRQQKDKRLDHVRRQHNNDSLSYIQFISWEQCKAEHLPSVYRRNSPDEWNSKNDFFCGFNTGKKPASDRESTEEGPVADWFSGAVVVCKQDKPFGFASRHIEYKVRKQPGNSTSEWHDVGVRIFLSFHGWDNFTNWMKEVELFSFGCSHQGSFFTATTLLIVLFIFQK